MSLFQWGDFTLHSGDKSWWRIDCDALTDSEIELFAKLIAEKVGPYTFVASPTSHPGSAVPKLVAALYDYVTSYSVGDPRIHLIVDDVLTTGNSLEQCKVEIMRFQYATEPQTPVIKGCVLFARGKCPDWVTPIFQMPL